MTNVIFIVMTTMITSENTTLFKIMITNKQTNKQTKKQTNKYFAKANVFYCNDDYDH